LEKVAYSSWLKKGNDGRDSNDILIDWMTTGSNYDNYKGCQQKIGEAKTKASYCHTIAEEFVKVGLPCHGVENIQNYINGWEKKFKSVIDSMNTTGFGTGNLIDPDSDHDYELVDRDGKKVLKNKKPVTLKGKNTLKLKWIVY
jgi:hypothetical protein